MTRRAWRLAPLIALALVGCRRGERPSAATGRADSAAGPGTRTTQLFINYGDNSQLDGMGFAPLGQVVEGMDVVDALYGGYGEGAPRGRGPDQGRIQLEGNVYLEREFPRLDYVRVASIVTP